MRVRAEFRSSWLSAYRVPLNFLNTYLKAFFPLRVSNALVRFKPDAAAATNLRIWVRQYNLGTAFDGCDVTRLFKHKARFPHCIVTCQSILWSNAEALRDMELLINHDNPLWRKSVSRGRISQVRLGMNTNSRQITFSIVVKEKFAEPWMKVVSAAPPTGAVDRFLQQYGFVEPEGHSWIARVSVDYS